MRTITKVRGVQDQFDELERFPYTEGIECVDKSHDVQDTRDQQDAGGCIEEGKGRLKGNTNVAKISPNMNNTEKMMIRAAFAYSRSTKPEKSGQEI